MRKILLWVMLFFIIFAGCTASRTVKNNLFESSSPKMAVTVLPAFKYFKHVHRVEYHRSLQGNRQLKNDIDTYYFFKTAPEGTDRIAEAVVLELQESEGTYMGDLFKIDNALEHGMAELGSENYEFLTQVFYLSMPKQVMASLKKQRLLLPRCALVKQHKKIDSLNRKQIKTVVFWQDVAQSQYSCEAWKTVASLTAEQKAFLQEFNKRATEAFKIDNSIN